MTSQWESREKRNKRMAIILSVVLHIVVIAALSGTAAEDGGGLKSLIESVFSKGDDGQDQTAVLEGS